MQQKLKQIYHQLGKEGAYTKNKRRLLELLHEKGVVNATEADVKQFLTSQPDYTVHKRVRRRQFPRRHIRVAAKAIRVDADLIEVGDLAKWNNDYHYILVVIDTFSKYVWARAVRRKQSDQVAKALLDMPDLQSVFLYSDAGKEFTGAPFQEAIRKLGMSHRICTSSEFHCPFVERVIQSLKERLFQAMTHKRTRRWVDLLPGVVDTYNASIHSTTKLAPNEAHDDAKTLEVYTNTMKRYPTSKRIKYKYKKGDLVRILKSQENLARKGYLPQFTWEIFRIRQRANNRPLDRQAVPAYLLEDLKGEEIENAVFYEDELSLVDVSQLKNREHPIREILARRQKDGVKWVKVWWLGSEKKDAEWIRESQIV